MSTLKDRGDALYHLLFPRVTPLAAIARCRWFLLVVVWFLPVAAGAQTQWKDFDCLESLPDRLKVQAGGLVARDGGRLVLLTDGVELQGQNLQIRADWMEIVAEEHRVVLAGAVRLIEGRSVLLCDRLELDQPTSAALIRRAVILVKQRISWRDLSGCRTASDLLKAGFNALTLQGEKLTRKGGRYDVEGARFTACDCEDEAPSWEIRASRAEVLPGERAWLTWPVLYLKGLPVFVLPAAYLPLGDRKTGLLFPQLNYSGRDGLVLSESFFFTLGASADTTPSLDWFEERGFRERLEFRALPGGNSRMEANFFHIDDRKVAANPGWKAGHHRFSGELDAWIPGSTRTSFAAAVRLYSDSDIQRDFISEMAGKAADDALSSAVFGTRGTDASLVLDVVYRQDLRFGGVDLFGTAAHDTIQRLGAFSFHLAPTKLFSLPIEAELFVEGANLSSLSAAWRDWGLDGTNDGNESPSEGEGDLVLGDGELRRALRLLVEPKLRLPFRFSHYLTFEAGLSHRQMAYLPHGPQAPSASTRGITYADLNLGTELSRTFGSGDARIGHGMAPWVRLAGAFQGLATAGPSHYLDLRDRLFEDAVQLLFGFDTALYRLEKSNGWTNFFNLELLQGVDVREGGASQGALEVKLSLGPFGGKAWIACDWQEREVAELDSWVGVQTRRGDSLRISYLYLPSLKDSAGRPLPLSQRVQLEEGLLFGGLPAIYRSLGDTLQVLEGRAAAQLAWGWGVNAGANLDLVGRKLNWYGGGVVYNSDCQCWGFSLTVRMLRDQDFPDIFFILDLAYLGAAGVGTNTRF